MVTLTTRVPAEVLRRLKIKADSAGTTIDALVNQALEQMLKIPTERRKLRRFTIYRR